MFTKNLLLPSRLSLLKSRRCVHVSKRFLKISKGNSISNTYPVWIIKCRAGMSGSHISIGGGLKGDKNPFEQGVTSKGIKDEIRFVESNQAKKWFLNFRKLIVVLSHVLCNFRRHLWIMNSKFQFLFYWLVWRFRDWFWKY